VRYFFIICFIFTQSISTIQADTGIDVSAFKEKLLIQYQQVKQADLDKFNIIPKDIYPLIETVKSNKLFDVKQVGLSYLKRPIYKIKVGNGPRQIFMWSQMHGDESTATASLFDLINYISSPKNKAWVNTWHDKITVHMVPMVNPDGAKLKQRYNAQSIDINRDAKYLQTSEGKMLASLADEIQPEFGFNLHDQGRFYSVGETPNTATISVLAPAYNVAKNINKSRHKAMQLIGLLNDTIQTEIPGHVGRYDDSYAFRAFGDLFSSKGIATTLIESGHYPGDPHRQTARWLTFMSLVQSIDVISSNSYQQETLEKYHSIPMNKSNGLVDLLLKNVTINDSYTVDISINFGWYIKKAKIKEIGDLSANFGLNTINMSQYKLMAIKGYKIDKAMILTTTEYLKLLKQGFGYLIGDESLVDIKTTLPFLINPKKIKTDIPQRRGQVSLLFTQNKEVKLAVINGIIIDIDDVQHKIDN